jgi:hypothetical protein
MATDKPSPATSGRGNEVRLSRGDIAMGTDGVLGTLHQIIMDQRTGRLQALVIATNTAQRLELPVEQVQRVAGSTIYLNMSARDLREHPELAVPYNSGKYVPVNAKSPLAAMDESQHTQHAHAMVKAIARNTVDVIVPSRPDVYAQADDNAIEREAAADTATGASDRSEGNPEHRAASEAGDDSGDDSTIAVPVITPTNAPTQAASTATAASTEPSEIRATDTPVMNASAGLTGLENATRSTVGDIPWAEEEGAFMNESERPGGPYSPGAANDVIYNDENTVPDMLDQSQQSYTQPTPSEQAQRAWGSPRLTSSSTMESGSQLSWVPAAALGTLIAGIAVWSTVRAIRRGRRRAAEAAQNAWLSAEALRHSVRDSVRDAGRSAAELAQSVRASAQELAANPRDTATDAFSRLSDARARYRWFRRGMRVGARTARLRRD